MSDDINTTIKEVIDEFDRKTEDVIADLYRQLMNRKETALRQALIDMGWTPPEGG